MTQQSAAIVKYQGRIGPDETQKILSFHVKGANNTEIAELVGRSRVTVANVIKEYTPFLKEIAEAERFENVRRNLLTAAESRVLRSVLDEDKHRKASLRDAAYALTQVSNARRLEEGKSTANIDQRIAFTRLPAGAISREEPSE